jgi:alkylhydroperoxidase family enzyme
MTTRDEPRITSIPPKEWPPEMRAALAVLRPENPRHPLPPTDLGRPKGLNVLGMFAHHPDLTLAYNTFNGHILFGSTLTPRQREVLVLRVAAVRDATYEWKQHEVMAGDAGLTPEDVAAIAEGPESPGLAPLDRAMVRAVDELVADAMIGDETWAELADAFDDQQLLDLVFTVGAYEILAMAFRTFAIPLDADLQ